MHSVRSIYKALFIIHQQAFKFIVPLVTTGNSNNQTRNWMEKKKMLLGQWPAIWLQSLARPFSVRTGTTPCLRSLTSMGTEFHGPGPQYTTFTEWSLSYHVSHLGTVRLLLTGGSKRRELREMGLHVPSLLSLFPVS